MVMTFEIRDLQYFAVVAEQSHVSRAAEELGLSQPALSKSLRRLETALRVRLVERTPKGVQLTVVGKALWRHAHGLKLFLDDISREVTDLRLGRVGSVRIGAGVGIAEHLLASACSALLQAAPGLELTLSVASNAVLLPALRRGDQDLVVSGIPPSPYTDLVQEPLYDDPFVVYGSAKHRLAKRKLVSIPELGQERWALSAPDDLAWTWLKRLFEDHRLPPPRIAFQTAAALVRAEAVAMSDLLSFSPRRMLRHAWKHIPLVEIRVKGLAWTRPIGISYRRGQYLSPAARRAIDLLKSSARDLSKHNTR
jgi:DNA-binding transcriptional LysR family regulator